MNLDAAATQVHAKLMQWMVGERDHNESEGVHVKPITPKTAFQFKEGLRFEVRKHESSRMRDKYTDRLPIIIGRDPSCTELPHIDKYKYLVPSDFTMGQLVHVIRRRLNVERETAVILQIQTPKKQAVFPTGAQLMVSLYEDYRDPDGFLYIQYGTENVFGKNL
jgi:GABA(A) receptor-associated protein